MKRVTGIKAETLDNNEFMNFNLRVFSTHLECVILRKNFIRIIIWHGLQ